MRPSDAIELVALVSERWPSADLSPEQQRRFAEEVADLDAEGTRAALDAIYREGGAWAPTAGAVRLKLAALELGAPDWSEVRRQLVERRELSARHEPPPWTCPYGACDGSGFALVEGESNVVAACRCRPERTAAQRLAESLSPLVREFIRERYVTWGEVEEVGRGGATTLEAQMRSKWESFAARAVESRAFATIESAPGLARLEQARHEDAGRRDPPRRALRRLDPLAALEPPEEAA